MAAVGGKRPTLAPDDPTLPKPWRKLIDTNTGYIYYWNPLTKVTQYQRPKEAPEEHREKDVVVEGSEQLRHDPPANGGQKEREQKAFVSGNGNEVGNVASSGQDQAASTAVMKPAPASTSEQPVRTAVPPPVAMAPKSCSSDAEPILSTEAYRLKHEITIIGDVAPAPFTTFQATGFPGVLLRQLQLAGFKAPTPIQAQSWPIALRHRDIVAIAKTGSGKTLGYLLPGFIHLKSIGNNSKLGPTVLVLSPTRELATQIQDEAEKFGRVGSISCACLYGGAPKGPQIRDIERGADVVVATPGRLNDILEMRKVSLEQVSYLVLDEADRMLDMGFEPQIRKIVNNIPSRRQTLMFTATWPKEVRKIAGDLLSKPVQVNIGNSDQLVANKSITQHIMVISPTEKRSRLEGILQSLSHGSKVIIFCATKRMCDQLARILENKYNASAIHGDKSQAERDSVLSHFRSGRCPVLVATDVAARGLDIKDIRVVINYDFPTGVEDYVHRIGRTGRAGATGDAYTFFCEQDGKYAADLVKILEGADQSVPAELREMVQSGGYGGRSRRWSSPAPDRDYSYKGGNDTNTSGTGGNVSFHERFYGGGNSGNNNGASHDGGHRSRSRSPARENGPYSTQKSGW